MTVNVRLVARFGRLSIDIERVRAAHHLAEDALVKHDGRVDEWYAENLKRDPSDAEFLAYLHAEQKDDSTNGYPHVLRIALFITAYSMLEFFMTSLCKELHAHVSGPQLNELRGEGIQRARLFLIKVARVAFPDTEEWSRLVLYGKLRNALAHSFGDFAGNQNIEAIGQLRRRVGTFSQSADLSTVTLGRDFNPTFLATVDSFRQQLDAAMGEYIVPQAT